jgi:hypothetical protein
MIRKRRNLEHSAPSSLELILIGCSVAGLSLVITLTAR